MLTRLKSRKGAQNELLYWQGRPVDIPTDTDLILKSREAMTVAQD